MPDHADHADHENTGRLSAPIARVPHPDAARALDEAPESVRAERDRLRQQFRELQESELRARLALQGANDGWWDWDLTTGRRYYSPRGWAMLGYADGELPYDDHLWERLVHPEDAPHVNRAFLDAMRGGMDRYSVELRMRHKDGEAVPVLFRGYILRDESGRVIRLSGASIDLSDRKRAEAERRAVERKLADSLDLLRQLAQRIPGVIYQFRRYPDGRICLPFASNGLLATFELTPAQVVDDATPLLDRVHPDDRELFQASMLASAATLQPWHAEYRVRLPQQGTQWRQGNAQPERLADGSVLWHGYIADSTERKQAEADTHRLAYFDELTGLPNRRLLRDRIAQSLASAQRSGQYGALLFLDLDNFKRINDARGHSVGDSLLSQVSQRLTELLRTVDMVSRLGGDEFVVLVNDLGNEVEAAARSAQLVAERVRRVLESPYRIDGHLYSGTGSIGLTMFPKEGNGVDDLLREADTAMYRAKAAGRNRIAYYEAGMQAEVEERLALEQDLNEAIAGDQMDVFVQAQFDARGVEVGGELLLRWNHPVWGLVSPERFIPIAEESELILSLSDLVLGRACDALVRLQEAGLSLSLSVNLSPRQFRQDDFVARVRAALERGGAPASRLVFEVTEGLLIEKWEHVASRMAELAAMGIRFSIDDFGTGYSSLAYLKKLPLDELKIDRSFVQDTPDDPNDTAIVRAIVSVAKHLRLRVVAEGVETRAQADFLRELQIDVLQGFLYAHPVPLEAWLAGHVPAKATARTS